MLNGDSNQPRPAPRPQPNSQQSQPQTNYANNAPYQQPSGYQQNSYPQPQYYQQQAPQANVPPAHQAYQQEPQQIKVQSQGVNPQSVAPTKKKRSQEPREILEKHVNVRDDYFSHHLKYELTLCKFSSASRIQKRQILEHFNLQKFWGNLGGKGINIMAYL